MTHRPDSPRPSDDSDIGYEDIGYERESTTGIPRWVKLSGIVALLLALMVVVMMLIGGGEHGPSRHGSDDFGGQAPPSSVAAVHVPP